MENNKRSAAEIISVYMTIIGGISTFMGFSVYGIITNRDNIFIFIKNNIFSILIISYAIFLIIYIFVVFYNKIKKQENLFQLSILTVTLHIFCFAILIYLKFNSQLVFANNEIEEIVEINEEIESEIIEDIIDESIDESVGESTETVLTPEQVIVNYYVPICKQEIFDTEFWSTFKDDELQHILNGIYAYEGMIFPGDYYDNFTWYHRKVEKKDFTANMLCYNQHKNIANIIIILKQRGLR